MKSNLGRSRRGGGSAPPVCRNRLKGCMLTAVRSGGDLRRVGKSCMVEFNTCRSKRGRKLRERLESR